MLLLMCAAYIVMLMLRGVPSMAMQGTGGVAGMGDEYGLSNTQKGIIYSCWGWGQLCARTTAFAQPLLACPVIELLRTLDQATR